MSKRLFSFYPASASLFAFKFFLNFSLLLLELFLYLFLICDFSFVVIYKTSNCRAFVEDLEWGRVVTAAGTEADCSLWNRDIIFDFILRLKTLLKDKLLLVYVLSLLSEL